MLTPNFTAAACELIRKVRLLALTLAMMVLASPYLFAAIQEAAHEEEHASSPSLIWPIANFLILCGTLYYFLNKPLSTYLADRHKTIRKDLVDAAELKASAAAQLAQLDQKLQALPGELDALRKRGAEETKAEEARITAAAHAERDRLLDQARREIELQTRLAKREILEHAADLSVQLASERLKHEVTPADHERLVDRYLEQVRDKPSAQGR
jgi:F-type H+-transporting ATPase subunit b